MSNDEKRNVNVGGKRAPGVGVPILRVENEPWTEIMLGDGTLVRLKLSVYEATKLDDAYEGDGTPIYVLKYGVMQHTVAPESLKGPPP